MAIFAAGCDPRLAGGLFEENRALESSTEVTVLFHGLPRAGAIVAVQEADGVPVASAITGADGRATVEVPAGGMITVGVQDGPRRYLTTTVGIAGAAELLVELARRDPEPSSITVPVRFRPLAGTTDHQVASCPNQYFVDPPFLPTAAQAVANDSLIDVPGRCTTSTGTASVMVVGKSPAGEIVSFGGRKGLVAGQPLEATTPITMRQAISVPITWSNTPAAVDGSPFVVAYVLGFWFADGIGVGNGYADALASGDTTVTGSMAAPADELPRRTEVEQNFYDRAINGFVALVGNDPRTVELGFRVAGDFPGPTSIDFTSALPAIDSVTVDTSALPSLNVAWTSVAPLDEIDGARLVVSAIDWEWNVVLPPGTTQVAFPGLPPELADFAPPGDGREIRAADLFAIDSTDAAGYADLRADWFRFLALDPASDASLRFSESSQF